MAIDVRFFTEASVISIPQIDAFRIPDNVELTEFMEVKITLEINCGAVHGVQVVRVVAA